MGGRPFFSLDHIKPMKTTSALTRNSMNETATEVKPRNTGQVSEAKPRTRPGERSEANEQRLSDDHLRYDQSLD
jgi:hypothetical protein